MWSWLIPPPWPAAARRTCDCSSSSMEAVSADHSTFESKYVQHAQTLRQRTTNAMESFAHLFDRSCRVKNFECKFRSDSSPALQPRSPMNLSASSSLLHFRLRSHFLAHFLWFHCCPTRLLFSLSCSICFNGMDMQVSVIRSQWAAGRERWGSRQLLDLTSLLPPVHVCVCVMTSSVEQVSILLPSLFDTYQLQHSATLSRPTRVRSRAPAYPLCLPSSVSCHDQGDAPYSELASHLQRCVALTSSFILCEPCRSFSACSASILVHAMCQHFQSNQVDHAFSNYLSICMRTARRKRV